MKEKLLVNSNSASQKIRSHRREIEPVLTRISPEDIQPSLDILRSVFETGKSYQDASSLLPLLKNPSVSNAVKSIGLFIYRSWRLWSSTSLVDSVAALKDLHWLLARLNALQPEWRQPHTSTVGSPDSLADPMSHEDDVVRRGIILAYRLCIGRNPAPKEIDSWRKTINDDLEFADFLTLIYGSSEAEKYRKSTFAFVTVQPGDRSPNERDAMRDVVMFVYQLCLGRTPHPDEIDIWKNNFRNGVKFAEFFCLTDACPEGEKHRKASLSSLSHGLFVQLAYESILGSGVSARYLDSWATELACGRIDRGSVLQSIFKGYADAFALQAEGQSPATHDGLSCHVMGTGQFISVDDWKRRAQELEAATRPPPREPVSYSRFHIKREPMPLVSAIASLYRGGKFIEQFMDNITSQSAFHDYCELVIVDADSPENESAVIERYCERHKNIVYQRINHRIGIYDAWNVGVRLARGEYLTNTNLDDLRRTDSLELQAAVLDNLPFVDVVYQDFLYTFDPRLSVEEITRFGYKSSLPIVTSQNMMDFNSPHNAPMWRKSLHLELGYFDESYKSAGDYEFWMRCLSAHKVFYKINDPHVVYYQNPEGLSTRPDSRGVEEAKRILKTYGRRLVSENVVMPVDRFVQSLSPRTDAPDRLKGSRYTRVQHVLREAAIRQKFAHCGGRVQA
ncbi:MAG: glycosyltransferase [Chloroflexi bacterium]|nr:glycosyltransferase [Chloroflexota bacterium]